jgi:hypothetical protein
MSMRHQFLLPLLLIMLLLLSGCLGEKSGRKGFPRVLDFTQTSGDVTPVPTEIPALQLQRPDLGITVLTDFCSCLDGQADILNNCSVTCANRPTTTFAKLIVNTALGADFQQFPNLNSLDDWCTKEVDSLPELAPSCKLELTDPLGFVQRLNVQITSNGNTFSADIINLPRDITYVAKLVEQNSQAKTTSFQIRRIQPPDPNQILPGLLKVTPVTQYTCITRAGSTDSFGNNNFDAAVRLHFYFPPSNVPAPLPDFTPFIFCHDIAAHGESDSALYNRLEQVPNQFLIWDYNDIRFYDLNADTRIDVNQYIDQKLFTDYNIINNFNYFNAIKYPNRPPNIGDDVSQNGPNSNINAPLLGHTLVPWIDGQTGKTFCPSSTDLSGPLPVFRILNELIGPTEAIYMGVKEFETYQNGIIAPTDIIMIREGLLKKIWFYVQNGLPIEANEVTATQRSIHFYWPPSLDFPRIKRSDQKLFSIRHPSQIGAEDNRLSNSLSYIPPDKRFACIPDMGEALTWPEL